jgi:hypothetical protein
MSRESKPLSSFPSREIAHFRMSDTRVSVRLVTVGEADYSDELGSACEDANGRYIFLSSELGPEMFKEVLLHEMIHVASGMSSLDLPEHVVQTLALLLKQANASIRFDKDVRPQGKSRAK